MVYEISLNNFSGPLQKLLELIEERKYEVTTVNLAKVTGDFLDYVRTVEKSEPRLLADFVAVAARLILIKSKTLIPDLELTSEEESDIRDLELRLKLYREFKLAEPGFSALWRRNLIAFAKEPVSAIETAVFYPPKGITAESLLIAASSLNESLIAQRIEEEKYETVNFEEFVADLSSRISGKMSRFSDLSESKEKKEVILLFLALLHLLKDSKVSMDQEGQFADIIIKSNE
ncbi:MAG: ScpA family protein [Candidatus Colwellbacteria bacterium]|nr:ScpA family protein [Candidatus Colwellbacteria bacterium]